MRTQQASDQELGFRKFKKASSSKRIISANTLNLNLRGSSKKSIKSVEKVCSKKSSSRTISKNSLSSIHPNPARPLQGPPMVAPFVEAISQYRTEGVKKLFFAEYKTFLWKGVSRHFILAVAYEIGVYASISALLCINYFSILNVQDSYLGVLHTILYPAVNTLLGCLILVFTIFLGRESEMIETKSSYFFNALYLQKFFRVKEFGSLLSNSTVQYIIERKILGLRTYYTFRREIILSPILMFSIFILGIAFLEIKLLLLMIASLILPEFIAALAYHCYKTKEEELKDLDYATMRLISEFRDSKHDRSYYFRGFMDKMLWVNSITASKCKSHLLISSIWGSFKTLSPIISIIILSKIFKDECGSAVLWTLYVIAEILSDRFPKFIRSLDLMQSALSAGKLFSYTIEKIPDYLKNKGSTNADYIGKIDGEDLRNIAVKFTGADFGNVDYSEIIIKEEEFKIIGGFFKMQPLIKEEMEPNISPSFSISELMTSMTKPLGNQGTIEHQTGRDSIRPTSRNTTRRGSRSRRSTKKSFKKTIIEAEFLGLKQLNLNQDKQRLLQKSMLMLEDKAKGDKKIIEFGEQFLKCNFTNVKVHISIHTGSKVCIMGDEDSGVDTFIANLISDNYVLSGEKITNGSITLINHDTNLFIEGMSIKDNITFGHEFVASRYRCLIDLLRLEFSKYPEHEETLLMRHGVNLLREDQKKVLLARCLYEESDIYVIHNFFDVFPNNQELLIFKKLIRGYLLEKTVIFNSNHLKFVRESDIVHLFEDGELKVSGTYAQVEEGLKRISNNFAPHRGKTKRFTNLGEDEEDEMHDDLQSEIFTSRRGSNGVHDKNLPSALLQRRSKEKREALVLKKDRLDKREDHIIQEAESVNRILDSNRRNLFTSHSTSLSSIDLLRNETKKSDFLLFFLWITLSSACLYLILALTLPTKIRKFDSFLYRSLSVLLISVCLLTFQILLTNLAFKPYNLLVQGLIKKSIIYSRYQDTVFNGGLNLINSLRQSERIFVSICNKKMLAVSKLLGLMILYCEILGIAGITFFVFYTSYYLIFSRFKGNSTVTFLQQLAEERGIDKIKIADGIDEIRAFRRFGKEAYKEKEIMLILQKDFFSRISKICMEFRTLIEQYMPSILFTFILPHVVIFASKNSEDSYTHLIGAIFISMIVEFTLIDISSLKSRENEAFIAVYNMLNVLHQLTNFQRTNSTVRNRQINKEDLRTVDAPKIIVNRISLIHAKSSENNSADMMPISIPNIQKKLPPFFTLKEVTVSIGNINILKKISLKIERGSKICILGGRDSGAFMLLKLLMPFYSPLYGDSITRGSKITANGMPKLSQKGDILIEGKDIGEASFNLLDNKIVYLGSDPNLMNGSVWRNIIGKLPTEEERKQLVVLLSKLRLIETLQALETHSRDDVKENNDNIEPGEIDEIKMSEENDFYKLARYCQNNRFRIKYLKCEFNKFTTVSSNEHRDPRRSCKHRPFLRAIMTIYEKCIINGEELTNMHKPSLEQNELNNFSGDYIHGKFISKRVESQRRKSIKFNDYNNDQNLRKSNRFIQTSRQDGPSMNTLKNQGNNSSIADLLNKEQKQAQKSSRLIRTTTNTQSHALDEEKVIECFLGLEVGDRGERLPLSLRRLICLSRVIYTQPECILVEDAALQFGTRESGYMHSTMIASLPKTTVISVIGDMRLLELYDNCCLINKGLIIYKGKREHVYKDGESFLRYLCEEYSGEGDWLLKMAGYSDESRMQELSISSKSKSGTLNKSSAKYKKVRTSEKRKMSIQNQQRLEILYNEGEDKAEAEKQPKKSGFSKKANERVSHFGNTTATIHNRGNLGGGIRISDKLLPKILETDDIFLDIESGSDALEIVLKEQSNSSSESIEGSYG